MRDILGDMPLDLPKDLQKGDGAPRTASTPAEYWNLRYAGYTEVDGPAVASVSYDELTPAQKAARTRAENKAREEAEQNAGGEQNPDVDLDAQAGDANESTDA